MSSAKIEFPKYAPGPDDRRVRDARGQIQRVPDDWIHVPPGDPALTRRLKAAGPSQCWLVEEKRGRKMFSRGLFAPAVDVVRIRADLEVERSDPAYAKKQAAAKARRDVKQAAYVEGFRDSVLAFLDFPLQHHDLAAELAKRVTTHATPVGSGTVARTERISVERRAEAAVIAWMRHATTAYDDMRIPREKGKRREVRRMLADRSRGLLDRYRRGTTDFGDTCPLRDALQRPPVR